MIEGIRRDQAPSLPALAHTAQAPRLVGHVSPRAHAGPGPAAAEAAMDRLRATALRTLREHLSDGRRCARCHLPWPCDPASPAASALEAG